MNDKDFINREYEARAMITKEQYDSLMEYYSSSEFNTRKLTIVNTYYDYRDLRLTNNNIVLRLRNTNLKEFELTLKIKEKDCDLEYNQELNVTQYTAIDKSRHIIFPEIRAELDKRNIYFPELIIAGLIFVKRLEVEFEDYLLVIDHNTYSNTSDYNVEVESTSREVAKKYLIEATKKFGVEYKAEYLTKSKRAIFAAKAKRDN